MTTKDLNGYQKIMLRLVIDLDVGYAVATIERIDHRHVLARLADQIAQRPEAADDLTALGLFIQTLTPNEWRNLLAELGIT